VSHQSFIRYLLKCPLRTLRFRLFISFVVGYVFGGFVQATFFSNAYTSLAERIKNGIAESFMGSILFGMGWEFGNTVNLWPYIALNTCFVFFIWMVGGYFRARSIEVTGE
jgi:hypothetical protein